MKIFRTPVEPPELAWKTGYKAKNIFMGSCFTENMGERMAKLCFAADVNPFGIVYNPASMAQSLLRLVKNEPFAESDLVFRDGLWHSFMHHGSFSGIDKNAVLESINHRLEAGHKFLKQADFLFITLGTAWVFELKNTGMVVSNCHKFPASNFCHFRLGVTEIVDFLHESLDAVWKINPALRAVFTVSPIRHLKDGAVENQLSKSTLLLAVDSLVHGFGDKCAYFPAYEIVMDELRDYRFYADDMVHISAAAIDYIWEKFEKAAIDKESREIAQKISDLHKDMNHKPFNPKSKTYRDFLEKTLAKINDVSRNYSYINLSPVKDIAQKKMDEYTLQ